MTRNGRLRSPSCETRLRELLPDAEPSATRKRFAQSAHKQVRTKLATKRFQDRISDTFLIGSYARNTAIYPLDDVDVVVVIDPGRWPAEHRTLLGFGQLDPEKVLLSFQRVLQERFKDRRRVQLQRRSVGLIGSERQVDVDVVPALRVAQGGAELLIPDRDRETWIGTAPSAHASALSAANAASGGQLVPLIKLVKYWNQGLPEDAVLKSFAIETLVLTLFNAAPVPSLESGLLTCLDFLASFLGKALGKHQVSGVDLTPKLIDLGFGFRLPDVTDVGANVVAGLENDCLKQFLGHAVIARDHVAAAIRSDDPVEVADLVNEVFCR